MRAYRVTYKQYYKLEDYPGASKEHADGRRTILCYNVFARRPVTMPQLGGYAKRRIDVLRTGIKYRLVDVCVTYLPVYNFYRMWTERSGFWTECKGIFKQNYLDWASHGYSEEDGNYTYVVECINLPDSTELVGNLLVHYLNSESAVYGTTRPDSIWCDPYKDSIRSEVAEFRLGVERGSIIVAVVANPMSRNIVLPIPELWTTYVNTPKFAAVFVYMPALRIAFLRTKQLMLLLVHTATDWKAILYYSGSSAAIWYRHDMLSVFSSDVSLQIMQDKKGQVITVDCFGINAEFSNQGCQDMFMATSDLGTSKLSCSLTTVYKADYIAHTRTVNYVC